MSKQRKPRSRSRSLSPTSKALARAQLKENKEDDYNQKSEEEEIVPGSKHWKKKVDEEKLKAARQEYDSLRAGLMTFKKDKMGTNLDENNIEVQAKYSALQIQRQKFLNSMKNTKHRENETLAKFNDFKDKIKTKEGASWMKNQVKFHVSSDQAYTVAESASYGETIGTGKNFEDFLTKGDPTKQLQYAKERDQRTGL